MSDTKPEVKKVEAPKKQVWKFAKGRMVRIPGFGDVTDVDLQNDNVIIALNRHQAKTGNTLFGTVIVKA